MKSKEKQLSELLAQEFVWSTSLRGQEYWEEAHDTALQLEQDFEIENRTKDEAIVVLSLMIFRREEFNTSYWLEVLEQLILQGQHMVCSSEIINY